MNVRFAMYIFIYQSCSSLLCKLSLPFAGSRFGEKNKIYCIVFYCINVLMEEYRRAFNSSSHSLLYHMFLDAQNPYIQPRNITSMTSTFKITLIFTLTNSHDFFSMYINNFIHYLNC